jgi:hypothetical protein
MSTYEFLTIKLVMLQNLSINKPFFGGDRARNTSLSPSGETGDDGGIFLRVIDINECGSE